MSCIVAIKKENKIFMGADSMVSINGEKKHLKSNSNKIIKGEDYIIGITGDFTIRNYFDDFKFPNSMKEFTEKIREYSEYCGLLLKCEEEPPMINFNMLVAWNGNLYHFLNNLMYLEFDEPYLAIGSGSHYALGSLFETSKRNLTPEQKIIKAIECAMNFREDVGGKIIIENMEWE